MVSSFYIFFSFLACPMVLQHRVNSGSPLKRRSGLEGPQTSSTLLGFCKPKVIDR